MAEQAVAYQTGEVAREIAVLMDEIVGRVWGQFQARAAEFSLSGPEVKVLQALEPERPLAMRELSTRLHANPSNVTVAVGRLTARGLVTRQDGEDRRVKGVRLTETGIALRDRLMDRLAFDHPALSGLTPDECQTLRNLLSKICGRPQ